MPTAGKGLGTVLSSFLARTLGLRYLKCPAELRHLRDWLATRLCQANGFSLELGCVGLLHDLA